MRRKCVNDKSSPCKLDHEKIILFNNIKSRIAEYLPVLPVSNYNYRSRASCWLFLVGPQLNTLDKKEENRLPNPGTFSALVVDSLECNQIGTRNYFHLS